MDFGNSVNNFLQVAIGTHGYTIKIDVTGLLFYKVTKVQAQVAPADTQEPVTAESTLSKIQAYLNDSACPDLAFNFGANICIIFFKTSVFAYADTTMFALFGLRNAQRTTSDNDLLDFPIENMKYVMNLALKIAYELKKGSATKQITDAIAEEELRIIANN
jgi:hypothetical protein